MKKVLCCFLGLLVLGFFGCAAQTANLQKAGEAELHLERLAAECEKNEAQRCFELGQALLFGSQSEREKGKMFNDELLILGELYALKACDLNYGEGCFLYGVAIILGGLNELSDAEKKDPNLVMTKLSKHFLTAVEYNQKACDLGSVAGCDDLARAYLSGEGVKKDRKKAFVLSKKSCNLAQSNKEDVDIFDAGTARAGASCSRVGRMYYKGDAGVKQNKQLALRYFYKACEANSAECGMLTDGLAYKKDYKLAFKLAKKGCDLGNDLSCHHLGILYTQGRGVAQDLQKSFEIFYKLCHQNQHNQTYTLGLKQTGCYNLALSYANGRGVEKSYKKAFDIFKELCDKDEIGSACAMVGEGYFDAAGVRQDYGKAFEYFGKACDLGEQSGCESHKLMKEKPYIYGL